MRRLTFLAGLCLCSCFPPGDGREPPLDSVYFPVGLTLSSGADRLYVVNSDFDLQYNAGSVLVLDANRIRELLPRECSADADCEAGERCDDQPQGDTAASFWCIPSGATSPCGDLGDKSATDRALEPGRCNYVPLTEPGQARSELLLDAVKISAFATDSAYRTSPQGGGRLFVPVRGDATLHWLDVEDELGGVSGPLYRDARGRNRYLDCGQGAGDECDDSHRRGDDRAERTPLGDEVPVEPFAVAVSDDGEAVVTTHQTTGQLALFVNDWCNPETGPVLQSVLDGLPLRPVGLSPVPIPAAHLATATSGCKVPLDPDSSYQPAFLVSFRESPVVQVVRYFDAAAAAPAAPLLEAGEAAPIGVVPGFDARGISVDGSERASCEAACGDAACLTQCEAIPLAVYLANRFPAGLVVGTTAANEGAFPRTDLPNLTRVEALRGSPSRVIVGSVIDEQGQPVRRIFVVTFDTRFIYVYDPELEQVEARIYTGRGPHALTIDAQHGLGYVGHFTDSYIGVIDLDHRHRSFGEIVMTLGQPRAPRASK